MLIFGKNSASESVKRKAQDVSNLVRWSSTLLVMAVYFALGIIHVIPGLAIFRLAANTGVAEAVVTAGFGVRAFARLVVSYLTRWCFRIRMLSLGYLIVAVIMALSTVTIPWISYIYILQIMFACHGMCFAYVKNTSRILFRNLWAEQLAKFLKARNYYFLAGAVVAPFLATPLYLNQAPDEYHLCTFSKTTTGNLTSIAVQCHEDVSCSADSSDITTAAAGSNPNEELYYTSCSKLQSPSDRQLLREFESLYILAGCIALLIGLIAAFALRYYEKAVNQVPQTDGKTEEQPAKKAEETSSIEKVAAGIADIADGVVAKDPVTGVDEEKLTNGEKGEGSDTALTAPEDTNDGTISGFYLILAIFMSIIMGLSHVITYTNFIAKYLMTLGSEGTELSAITTVFSASVTIGCGVVVSLYDKFKVHLVLLVFCIFATIAMAFQCAYGHHYYACWALTVVFGFFAGKIQEGVEDIADENDILSDGFEEWLDGGESLVLAIISTAMGYLMAWEPKSLFYVTVITFATCTIFFIKMPDIIISIDLEKQKRKGDSNEDNTGGTVPTDSQTDPQVPPGDGTGGNTGEETITETTGVPTETEPEAPTGFPRNAGPPSIGGGGTPGEETITETTGAPTETEPEAPIGFPRNAGPPSLGGGGAPGEETITETTGVPTETAPEAPTGFPRNAGPPTLGGGGAPGEETITETTGVPTETEPEAPTGFPRNAGPPSLGGGGAPGEETNTETTGVPTETAPEAPTGFPRNAGPPTLGGGGAPGEETITETTGVPTETEPEAPTGFPRNAGPPSLGGGGAPGEETNTETTGVPTETAPEAATGFPRNAGPPSLGGDSSSQP